MNGNGINGTPTKNSVRASLASLHLAVDEFGNVVDENAEREIDAFADRDRELATLPPAVAAPAWKRGTELAACIFAQATKPWIALTLGGTELVRVRTGGIVVVMGPTGAGKTSFVAGLLYERARDGHVVVVLSRELPADEFAARIVGMNCDASWPDVLTAKVARSDVERVLDLPTFFMLDRKNATIAALRKCVAAARTEFPDAPIVLAVDYVQILESEERETRAKVADVVARIDDIARDSGAVVLAISQMSRASSRAARSGEAVGADTTDAGAESAAIERVATVTLAIGQSGPQRDDGTCAVDISIGKARMSGGDRVFPGSYCGRSGRWRLTGEARPAQEVQSERQQNRAETAVANASHAIADRLSQSAEPLSRQQLQAKLGVRRQFVLAAVARLLDADPPRIVEVRKGAKVKGCWPLWTPERALHAGLDIVPQGAK